MYPTKQQRETLLLWFSACRWTYNQCVAAVNSKEGDTSLSGLCRRFSNSDNFATDNTWVKDVPSALRQAAVRDVVKAVKAYKAKKLDNQKGFHLRFRTAHDPVQSIYVHSINWNHVRPSSRYASIFSTKRLRGGKEYRRLLRGGLPHDSRLVRDQKHRYFLCVPFDRPVQPRPASSIDRVVAIDPGVRTFLTTYDQDGAVNEWGKGDCKRLYRLAVHVYKMKQKATTVRHRQRYRLRRAMGRVFERIRNLTDEVHRKAARWLCATYDTIVIPAFQASQMVKKGQRRIRSRTVRSMLHWSHYRFRQRLLYSAEQYSGVAVKVVTEEYTSKTCGVCGALQHRLGGSKHFACPSCGWQCDRDVNGARNILLKTLTEMTQSHLQHHSQHVALLSHNTRHPLGGGVLAPSPVSPQQRHARLSASTETAEV